MEYHSIYTSLPDLAYNFPTDAKVFLYETENSIFGILKLFTNSLLFVKPTLRSDLSM